MRSLLSDTGFLVALVIAAVGVLVVAGAPRWSSAWSSAHIGFGYVVLVAALVAMKVDLLLGWRLVVGLVFLVVAGSARPNGPGATVRFVALVAGAGFVVASMPNVTGWMRVLGFVSVVAAVPTSGVVDRRSARLVPALFLVAVIGVYVCAPDTEYVKVLLGALVPVSLLTFEPALRASASTGAVSALVVWTAVVEGRGRPGAVVGSLACLAVVLLVAATRWQWRGARDALFVVAIDALAVIYLARVAGFRESAWAAALLAAPVVLLTWALLLLVTRRR